MPTSSPVDGFRLTYDRSGSGDSVVLLHGWPGDRLDYREVTPRLTDLADVVVPDLRGFGESDKHPANPAEQYSADAQLRSVVGLIEELELRPAVVAGYDVGSRVAQALAHLATGTRRRRPRPHAQGAGGVLVPGLPSAQPDRGDPRRAAGGRSRLSAALLVALVGSVV
jgi:pimeloyl-ACP methyl ester carboxylesterase